MFRDREMLDDRFQVTRKKNKVNLNEEEKRIRRKIFEKNLFELEKKIALKHPDAVEEGLIKQEYKDKYTNEWRAMIVQCFVEFKEATGYDLHFRKKK